MMIKIENVETFGWEAAIRGMRNPKNSWEKSDSCFDCMTCLCMDCIANDKDTCERKALYIGNNDLKLMTRLRNAGTDHRKFMRMITVYVDLTAPLYWWKEFDTYKVGTVANSCSTMHKIAEKEFTLDDFSHEHLIGIFKADLEDTIIKLEIAHNTYIYGGEVMNDDGTTFEVEPKNKDIWWQMIQLLPSSYNQKRTVMLNYEVLANIYKSRKNHKLDEWRDFCKWIEELPYSELITGKTPENASGKGLEYGDQETLIHGA